MNLTDSMKKSLLIFLFISIISCTSNTIFKKPDDLIPKEEMVDLLTDIYLTAASKPYRNKLGERNIDYTFLVYEKYGIDSARFKASNHYYSTKIDEYEKIYLEVEKNLKTLNTKYKTIRKIKDSIKKDSLKRVRFVKDSVLKSNITKDSILLAIINENIEDPNKKYDLKKVKTLRRTLNIDSLKKVFDIKETDSISEILDSLQTKTLPLN